MLSFLFGLSCSYYSPPVIEIHNISLPKAEHAYSLNTNNLMQDLKVTQEKMDHWINKNCYARGDINYHPITGEMIRKDILKKDLPPRFFAPLTVTIRAEQIFVGEEDVTEKKEAGKELKEAEEESKKVPEEAHKKEYGGQLLTGWGDLDVSRDRVIHKANLPTLYQTILDKRSSYRYFVEQCGPYYNIDDSRTALLVVEPDVKQGFLKRVLLTLIGAGVDSVAFYVDDASPSKKRASEQIGGVSGLTPKEVEKCPDCLFKVEAHTAVFALHPDKFSWKDSQGKEQSMSELPENLGEEFAPKAHLLLDKTSSVSTLFRYHDALAGAGVFCSKWELDNEVAQEWNTVSEKSEPQNVQIQRNMEIPVHLVHLFETGQDVFQRTDGVYCFRSYDVMDLLDDETYKLRRFNELLNEFGIPNAVPIIPEE